MGRTLFDDNDDPDEDISFQKSSEYSKKYDTLRRKEELLKLKNKYGDTFNDDDVEGSSSSEDIDDVTFSEKFEKDFYKTLACLKSRDPRIYDNSIRFFDAENESSSKSIQNKKEKPMTIRDYNREMILNQKLSDDDDQMEEPPMSLSYAQEQVELKKSFRKFVEDEKEPSDKDIGGLFSKKNKSKEEEEEEEKNYREWLCGQEAHLNNEEANELKPLKDFWSNPKLDENEAFLRDYVLNQRFKERNDSGKIPSYEEIVNDDDVSEDEKVFEQQTQFEHKFNFRFEEPDQDFIKRYPRTLEHSVRQKDDKRSKKRSEIRERKAEEKKRKKEEIAQLKALKLKEIQEKLSQLKEITGNDQLAFDPEDLDEDFDPESHDRKMQELFDDNFYGNEVDSTKPKFPELDEELGIENFEEWDNEFDDDDNNYEPHCEDEDFNMDCDYDPSAKNKKSLLENLKETVEGPKKKRKRKNKSNDDQSQTPLLDSATINETLSRDLDEYHKLDCEDVIGDMPCRYKYRQVPACDYGLTLEEILLADDKELNRWYPLKKTLQYRPEHLQLHDQKVYAKKAMNLKLKMKFFPSLFKTNEENDVEQQEDNNEEAPKKSKNKKKKKKGKKGKKDNAEEEKDKQSDKLISPKKHAEDNSSSELINGNDMPQNEESHKEKRRKKTNKISFDETLQNGMKNVSDDDNKELSKESSKSKNKSLNKSNNWVEEQLNINNENHGDESISKNKKKKNKNKSSNGEITSDVSFNKLTDVPQIEITKKLKDGTKQSKNKNSFAGGKIEKTKNKNMVKSNINKKQENLVSSLSDERLKAYGLNPKKYRSFMKFKKY